MASGLLVLGLVAACYRPTEVLTEYSTDVACEVVGRHGLEIRTARAAPLLQGTPAIATSQTCKGGAMGNDLGTLVLIPSGEGDDVVLEVVLGVDRPAEACHPPADVAGCIVARRRLSYVAHRTLRVPIPLERQCLGVPCREDQTCDRAVCVSALVQSCDGDVCEIASRSGTGTGGGGGGGGDGGGPGILDAGATEGGPTPSTDGGPPTGLECMGMPCGPGEICCKPCGCWGDRVCPNVCP